MNDRLAPYEASILKDLALRCGLSGRVTLDSRKRRYVVSLWRKGLVEVWFRQSPANQPTHRGPFYALTTRGFALGAAICAASKDETVIERPRRKSSFASRNQGEKTDARLSQ